MMMMISFKERSSSVKIRSLSSCACLAGLLLAACSSGNIETNGSGAAQGTGASQGGGAVNAGGSGGTVGSAGAAANNAGGLGGNGDVNGGSGGFAPNYLSCAESLTMAELGGVVDTASTNGPNSHGSIYGSNPRIIGIPRGDGSFDVAFQKVKEDTELFVAHISFADDKYALAGVLKTTSLGRLAGFSYAENGDVMLMSSKVDPIGGDVEPLAQHRDGILQLQRIGSDCQASYSLDMRTDYDGTTDRLPIYNPMTAGTGRLATGAGKYAFVYSQNTEYDEAVTQRHQIGRGLVGSETDGTIAAITSDISHCFDQRLHFDGEGFIGLSLGDASLRGIAANYITAEGKKTSNTIFAIKGGDSTTGGGYNNTFTRLGDIQASSDGYVAIFATEAGDDISERVNVSRNVALVHLAKNFYETKQEEPYDVVVNNTADQNLDAQSWDVTINNYWGKTFEGHNRGVVWLSNYADKENAHAERPKLVRWGEDRFFVLWEKWTLDSYDSTWVMMVDQWGRQVLEAKSIGSVRLDIADDAFLLNGNASWLEGKDGKLILHQVGTDLAHHELELN